MDWWKLFALLLALASFFTTLEGAKKKIRIHLPQKVKHIHHHKKIYITNHPASSQYAPAYLPTAEGAASSVAYQGGVVPLKSLGSDLYEDRPTPQLAPGIAPSASKLLPLYRARGYYGPQPQPSDWEEQEYDLVPPPEPTGPEFLPSAFSAPSAPAASSNYPPKRVKVIKVKESPRKKKIIRKRKPKRVIHTVPPVEEEHPVSTFHEQFYSDIDSSGTIKKIRKPKRVEKIIDGDTEHIHTYSEEHIHKVVFDDSAKLTGVVGGDPLASMSGLAAAHPLVPLKNHQTLLALEGGPLALATIGSHGTPSHIEYASYNPREVTHDHVFHEHGELPPNIDLSKEILGFPPKVSYTSQGLRITGDAKRIPGKSNYHKAVKPTRPTPPIDFSYYESMYTANGRPKKPLRPTKLYGEPSSEPSINDYRPIPAFNFKQKPKAVLPTFATSPYYGHSSVKPSAAYQVGQATIPVPFSTSSTVVHDVNPSTAYNGVKSHAVAGFSNFKDPFTAYKGVYTNNFEYDTHASSSNYLNKGNDESGWRNKGKKSISTQNVSFGGHDHKTVVDHLADASHTEPVLNEQMPSQVQQLESFDHSNSDQGQEQPTPTAHFTITENTASHDYFSNMALKAFQEDQLSVAEASNDNYHYVEAPTTQASIVPSLVTTSEPRSYYRVRSSETATPDPTDYEPDSRKFTKRRKQRNKASILSGTLEPRQKYSASSPTEEHPTEVAKASSHARPFSTNKRTRVRPDLKLEDHSNNSPQATGKFKYGDKI